MANMFPSKKKPTEHRTTLWTNSAPTSDFANQNVIMSQSADNYEYLIITVAQNKNTQSSNRAEFYIKVDEMLNYVYFRQGLTLFISGDATYTRTARLSSADSTNKTMNFTACYKYSGSSNTTANAIVIPIKIEGMNYQ